MKLNILRASPSPFKSYHFMMLIFSVSYTSAFFIASMDVGMISGLEWLGILVIFLLTTINWLVVKSVAI